MKSFEEKRKFKIIRPDGSVIIENEPQEIEWSEMFVGEGWYWLESEKNEAFLREDEDGNALCFARVDFDGKTTDLHEVFFGIEIDDHNDTKEKIDRILKLKVFR